MWMDVESFGKWQRARPHIQGGIETLPGWQKGLIFSNDMWDVKKEAKAPVAKDFWAIQLGASQN